MYRYGRLRRSYRCQLAFLEDWAHCVDRLNSNLFAWKNFLLSLNLLYKKLIAYYSSVWLSCTYISLLRLTMFKNTYANDALYMSVYYAAVLYLARLLPLVVEATSEKAAGRGETRRRPPRLVIAALSARRAVTEASHSWRQLELYSRRPLEALRTYMSTKSASTDLIRSPYLLLRLESATLLALFLLLSHSCCSPTPSLRSS